MEKATARSLSDLRSDYWMIQKLGCGGFGKVYLIRHRKSRDYCAAKHQRWHTTDVPRLTRREVVILKKLLNKNLDHVVRYIDYFEGERQSVILTEFLSGGELFEHISSADYQLTEAKCRDFGRQILRAVEFIHSRNVVHLDLKPQNIVLIERIKRPTSAAAAAAADVQKDGTGHDAPAAENHSNCQTGEKLKIIDLGLARDLGSADRIPINMCGTLEFMAPEVMRCSHASYASDMWSVGVILYMMVSGGLSPFWAGNEYRTQRTILRGQLANGGFDQPNFNNVSPLAIDCISKLLAVDHRSRFTTTQCLEHRWLTTAYLDTLKNLETVWMRKYLARRRWQRWFNTIKAMNRMIHMGQGNDQTPMLNPGPQDIGLDHYSPSKQQQQDERWV